MMDETFWRAHANAFEDFWNRRLDDSFFEQQFSAFGNAIVLQTNARAVADAAQMSAARYARAATRAQPPIELRVRHIPALPETPLPADFPTRLQTVGVGDFLFQAATPWLQWFADLNARKMIALLSPALAADARIVSRYVLDRAVLNFLVREGVGELHATTLVRDECALVLIAPHGTGKSTTAFHLLNAGYRLLGDGLLFVRGQNEEFELLGYPVGEVKLTHDARALFPEWRGEGEEVSVHNITKHVVNLRALAPHKMIADAIFPQRVILCLLERTAQTQTTVEPLDAETAFRRVLPDSLYWDEPEALTRSLDVLHAFIAGASCFRLSLGANRAQLVETIRALA